LQLGLNSARVGAEICIVTTNHFSEGGQQPSVKHHEVTINSPKIKEITCFGTKMVIGK